MTAVRFRLPAHMNPLLNNQEQLAIVVRLISMYEKTYDADFRKKSKAYNDLLKKAKELGKIITKQELLTNV